MDHEKAKQDDGSIELTFEKKRIVCPVCGNDRYNERGSLLNTATKEFFNFAWADQEATNYICTRCGYIYWFLL